MGESVEKHAVDPVGEGPVAERFQRKGMVAPVRPRRAGRVHFGGHVSPAGEVGCRSRRPVVDPHTPRRSRLRPDFAHRDVRIAVIANGIVHVLLAPGRLGHVGQAPFPSVVPHHAVVAARDLVGEKAAPIPQDPLRHIRGLHDNPLGDQRKIRANVIPHGLHEALLEASGPGLWPALPAVGLEHGKGLANELRMALGEFSDILVKVVPDHRGRQLVAFEPEAGPGGRHVGVPGRRVTHTEDVPAPGRYLPLQPPVLHLRGQDLHVSRVQHLVGGNRAVPVRSWVVLEVMALSAVATEAHPPCFGLKKVDTRGVMKFNFADLEGPGIVEGETKHPCPGLLAGHCHRRLFLLDVPIQRESGDRNKGHAIL